MAVMNRWIVWLSDYAGDFVRAHRAVEKDGFVSFIKDTVSMPIEVARYKIANIKEYKILE